MMIDFQRIRHFLYVVLAFGGCGHETNRSFRTEIPRSSVVFPTDGQVAVVKTDANGIIVANLDPQAQTTQIIQGSQSSRIKDYSVAFPPGAIAVSTNIAMQEGETFAVEELKSSAGIPAGTQIVGASVPVAVSASSPIDLAVPMIIAISTPTSFNLGGQPIPLERMGVIYRVTVQATGQRLSGVVPAASLTLQNNKILYPSRYFGWFQLTVFDQPIQESQQKDPNLWYQAVSIILTGQPLPSCGLGDVGRAVYVQEKAAFLYCNGVGWADIDLKGPQGPVGPTGSGASGYSLVDKNQKKIGALLGVVTDSSGYGTRLAATVSVGSKADANLGVLGVNFETGDYLGGLCSPSSYSGGFCHCWYDNSTCTQPEGVCNLKGRPAKNGLFKLSSGAWVRALGTETPSLAYGRYHTPGYYFDGKLCKQSGSNATLTGDDYQVSTTYSYPTDGTSVPTSEVPLSVDQ